ncbi:Uncharacterised protein [Vibrio cholerae]|nr:Uncharacterised protein [Vibrio cholerae]
MPCKELNITDNRNSSGQHLLDFRRRQRNAWVGDYQIGIE